MMEKYLKAKREGAPRDFEVKSVHEYVELATWLYSSDKVVFRGQREDGSLIPAVGRNPNFDGSEREIIEEFKREAVPHLTFHPSSEWQWLAVAQHCGLPTRLLDWSKNPLTALWFAVEAPAKANVTGIVWAHEYGMSSAVHNSGPLGSPFEIDRTYVYFPEHVYPNIQAQAGVFTVHHRGENERFVPFESIQDADLLLSRICIPARAFPAIRYHLFKLGVNPASMYPGLSGLAKRIRYQKELLADEGLPS